MDKSRSYDIIFRGGHLIDGTGKERVRADLAVSGERVAAIGDLSETAAKQVIDISGKILCPGFIDVHTHDDRACIDQPAMLPKISQGVTTVIVGNCGLSLAPLLNPEELPEPLNLLGEAQDFEFADFPSYIDAVDDARPAVNVAALVGHNTLRVATMADLGQKANPQELAAMRELLASAMDAGAVGLSSGVFYRPGQAADSDELLALAKVAAAKGGVYTTHLRDEYDKIIESMEEAFDTSSKARVPLIISHHKCAGVQNWGRTKDTLALIDKVRKCQSVHLDCYPYDAGSSVLDPELVDNKIEILVTWSQPYPEMGGRYLRDIAAEWQCTQQQAAERLLPGGGCYFQMHEDDVRRVLSHPASMVGSDGLPNDPHPHPRLWGAFPRVLGHYTRELELFSLEQAVHKMTGLSARQFGLASRGELSPNMIADLVVFDAETVSDSATYESPCQLASGIEFVCVNGQISWRHGEQVSARAGCFIKRNEESLPLSSSSPVVALSTEP